MKKQCYFIFMLMLPAFLLQAQETTFKNTSLKTGFGIGISEGRQEMGMGLLYTLGWQKTLGTRQKVRLNPGLIAGGYMPLFITDTRDQYYRITSVGLDLHYDLVRLKPIAIVVTGGAFANYSRGLLGTGGFPEANNTRSEYFHSFYLSGRLSAALRIAPENHRMAYEIRPLNFNLGKDLFMGYFMFVVDIKFKK